MSTTGHESEAINVQGLKASLQKLKANHIDGKAGKSTTLAGYGITDAYTKSETYTKTEVNGLVDTPHQEYVTVDAYASLPTTGNKDTIYRVSNYNGSTSQVDASVYSEYAWDGTQYIFLCVKSQIGEVFDISVYNNNAKYADLTAALDGGNNVPQSLRKGGMSIKYVQSSDNNYVQFRCIADEFTTVASAWQSENADDKPTAGSKNLVESGGVEAVVTSESNRAKTEEQKLGVNIKELPVVDEENGVLFLSDEQGNVIGKFYKKGLKTTNIEVVKGLKTTNIEVVKGLKTTNIEVVERIVSKLFQGNETYNSLYVSDENGNVIAKVNKTGIESYKVIGRYFQNSDSRTSFVVCDESGNVVLKADQNGVDYNGIVRQSDIPSPSAYMTIESDSNFPYDINMAITHGQSNSMNGDNNSVAQLDFKNSVTFANGKLSLAGGDYDNKTAEELDVLLGGGFSPMSEYTGNLFSLGGFIAGYISDIMNENKISDYNSFGNQFIGASTGQVTSIANLTNPNDVYYARIINAVTFAKKYADEQGKSFCVNALTYIEGEWDYTMAKKRFYDYLWVFFSNIAHDIMEITGQSFVPCFMTYQYASAYYMSRNSANHIISDGSNQALVQMAIDTGDGTGYTLDNEAAAYLKSGVTLIDRSNVHLSCPFYMLDSQEKNTLETMHLNWSEGCYNIFGAYQGLQAKRSITDGHSIGVLRPKSHTIKQMSNGKYVTTIEFDVPVPPLQIKAYDSNFGNMVTGVSYEPNYGFNLSQVSHSWNYENIIESVQAKRMKYVEIITTSNPTGLYLSYAQKGWRGGGNLCDSQGNMCKFTTRGKTFDLDNWCPQFEYQLV